MKNRTLAAVVLTGVLTVGAFAQGMNNQQNMQDMMKGQGMGMQMFSQLNLTSDQQFQLSTLKDEMRIEMKKLMHAGKQQRLMSQFIRGDSFDKTSFKKHMNKKHEKMLNLKADNMEKAFIILTKEQITQLKKNLRK